MALRIPSRSAATASVRSFRSELRGSKDVLGVLIPYPPPVPLVIPISEASDPRVIDYARLTDHDVRAADRSGGSEHFIAEGEWVLDRLIGSAFPIRSVLITPQRLEVVRAVIDQLPPETPVLVAPTAVLMAIAGFDFHRGVLVSGSRVPSRPALLETAKLVVAMEQVSNPDNVGGIFRSIAGLVGPTEAAVVIGPGCCDPLYRKAIRVSMGHVFSVPFVRDEEWPGSLTKLDKAGFRVLGLALSPDAVSIREIRPGPSERLAIVVGSEGFGLSAVALAATSARVVIPMAPGVDSLNVSVATAIAIYSLAG